MRMRAFMVNDCAGFFLVEGNLAQLMKVTLTNLVVHCLSPPPYRPRVDLHSASVL